ncbi:MAG: protein phosphatase 2C domain-containing protein [Gemmataceae bacterium]|nr:protein phosphatase 2C domain-containing protein [Gemmataceae bacterium]
MITCPTCGSTSRDREFCDYCNADLMPPPARPAPAVCPLTPEGPLQLTPEQAAALNRPEAAVTLRHGSRCWRLHWIPHDSWSERRAAVQERLGHRTTALPHCRLVFDREGVWLVAEAAPPKRMPWELPPAPDPLEELLRLGGFLGLLIRALEKLHARGLVWLTFDPAGIELLTAPGKPAGRVRFTNLDLSVYPARACPERLVFNPKFAAPEVARFRAADVGPATDVFHLALFAYYWLARLLPTGFFGSGLELFDFALPPLRIFAPLLPPGIAAVLHRGLAVEPARRFSSPSAFRTEFQAAVERAARRAASTTPVRCDLGSHTGTGKAKSALGRENQDFALERCYSGGRALLAVADGISTCDVGNGALASRMTCQLLETTFGAECSLEQFTTGIPAACRRAAQDLLSWAIRNAYRQRLIEGQNLMGTTLTVAWLEGNQLALANLGDSRAYLVDGTGPAEQLTVDGDLGSTLLAAGVPPEDVREAGPLTRALRDCVGGCVRSSVGELTIDEKCSTPRVSTWRLLPGDLVVLCTDGLVEEGIFLDPATLADLLRRHRDLSASELAVKLVDAADELQRPPSAAEPDGFGDNISCIVIKVLGSEPAAQARV